MSHTERAHSPIGPSSSDIWLNCPGSVAAQANEPNTSNPAAEWGTACHELAEACLQEYTLAADWLGHTFNGFQVDAEMAEMVQPLLEYVDQRREDFPHAEILVEQRVNLSHIHPEMFGTADVLLVLPGHCVEVIDLKTGWGYVEETHKQFVLYGLDAYHKYACREMRTTVVQPRHDPQVRSYVYTPETVSRLEGEFIEAAHRAMALDAPRIPGDHCKWCRFAGKCPEQAADSFAVMPAEPMNPATLTREQIGDYLAKGEQIEAFLKALRKVAHTRAMAGDPPAGYKLVQGRAGHRKWNAVAEEVLKNDGHTQLVPLSPAQLEKKLGKKEVAEMYGSLMTQQPGAPSLAPITDKRPAVTPAELDFQE